ncbi:Retrovirus-related Pol polyprotein from transposon 17.6 [Vitis vinifera]|uniref:Retrovirus-related Pol polyprotein from transposon 17.6 n=1 Tax=Vitis vinifera TaxID=29760 RepID=A0A438DGZ6_VITVI|nr:Retrovirus-related Pol polyprotein from transposon 17.6 [Vitis vinifera]
MLAMSLSQIEEIAPLELASPFDLFGVFVLEIAEEIQVALAPGIVKDVIVVDGLFDGPVGLVEGASDFVDPPLSFDVLSGFVSRHDYVSDFSSMDLSIFEYLPVCHVIALSAPSSPTSQIFDIDDEIGTADSLIQLLRAYLDVFAWSYEDMPDLDPVYRPNRLPLLAHARPVKQKLRRLHHRWSLHVKKEIQKQLSVGFLSVVKYARVAGQCRPYSQKGQEGHLMLSFMDESSRLKNVGATYQRAATTLFHDMMHRDVEVYVDDMIVKSRDRLDHLAALESERGIEVDPDKIRAILDMPAPRTEREVRGFLGRLQYISRFIARLIDICEPIFRLLRKSQPTVWDDQCQRAIREDQRVFVVTSNLGTSYTRPSFTPILSVSDVALGYMLAQLDDSSKDRAIYYMSKRMLDYETRYVMIERYCLALVWATRRLRHYMIEFLVHLISRLDHLRYLFDRPALVGHLMRWLVLLTKFDIHYVTQKSIRGSIVTDHLASLPVSDGRAIDDDFPDEDVAAVTSLSGWRMYFDGAANHSGYGIGVLLISPHGDHIPRSVRLAFSDRYPATNNIVEYEACISGLEMALELGIR